jgi:predicted amidohydrolase
MCDLPRGAQDVTGAGSREEQVYPSEEGVVAVDLDFGRISLAICEWQ